MLLIRRSIVLEVCVLLFATHLSKCEDYEYSAEDDDYSSEDGHTHPDYTKYFGGQPAASGVVQNKEDPNGYLSGFVNPAEFHSFFNSPIVFNEPHTKASTAPQTFAPQPQKASDPFEALRNSFVQKGAASETDPLKRDYFEESQKKQQAEESEISPGPHYVSHQIPVPALFNPDEEIAQSKDDVETIPPPLKGKHNKKKVQVTPSRKGYDGYKDTFDAFEVLRNTEKQIQETKLDPTTLYTGKHADYSTGKSSSTVSQSVPSAAGYLASLQIPTTTLSPYQKYSFQPDTSNYEALQSKYLGVTSSPAKYAEREALSSKVDGQVQPSNNIPENLGGKGCRQVASPENSDGMNCFVCEDANNKAKYTQCSYSSSEEPVNQYAGSSLRYSNPVAPPASFRYKRSPGKGSYSNDPYFQVALSNKRYFDDYEKEQKVAESKREKDFHYTPYDSDEYQYSESQSAELLKEPGACQKIDREGMTCTVCKNAKTGGNFEQCSYTSAPKEQKYAYVAEKKYDSEDDAPEESKTIVKQSSQELQKGETVESASTSTPVSKFTTATKSKIVRDAIPELSAAGTTIDETSEESPETDEEESDDEGAESDEESDETEEKEEESESSDDGPTYLFNYDELKKDKKLVNDDPYYVPEHFAESVNQKKTSEEADEENFDEYHYKLFPGFQEESADESRQKEEKRSQSDENQQDVEEVLAEFAKKDRSNCKKAQKNGMTCFLCVDKNKVQHEECMYIAESKPKATHVAFHEVQRLKDPKDEQPAVAEEHDEEETKVEYLTEQPLDTVLPLASEISKRKKFFKKVSTTPLPLENLELLGAASDVYKTVVPFEKPVKRYSRKFRKDSTASASAPDSERLEDDESRKKNSEEPETPKEIDVGDEEGAYSHETKPVYSERFGTTLPKYMVEKTEFEKEFDSVSGFE